MIATLVQSLRAFFIFLAEWAAQTEPLQNGSIVSHGAHQRDMLHTNCEDNISQVRRPTPAPKLPAGAAAAAAAAIGKDPSLRSKNLA